MLAALRQQFPPSVLAEVLQHVQPLVELFGSSANAGFANLSQPLRSMAGIVDVPSCTGNRPAAIHRFQAIYDPRQILDDGQITPRQLAQHDIGQTVVIAESACVAVEAMEGTDATIERAGQIMLSLHGEASTLSRALTVVKIAKPNQDMRFDVPVIGVKTIEVMQAAGASCLALDAGKCLLLDGQKIIDAADAAGIAMIAE